MLRYAVTAYLVLVALLGPGLCCCTVVQFLPGEHCQRGLPSTKAGRGCCQHGHSHDHRGDQPQQPDERPQCPCRNHQAIPVALSHGDGNLAELAKLGQAVNPVAVLVATADASLPLESEPAWSVEPGANAALTGRDILRALHVLRC